MSCRVTHWGPPAACIRDPSVHWYAPPTNHRQEATDGTTLHGHRAIDHPMQVLTMSPDHHESHGSGYGPNSWMNMSGGYSQAGPSPSMSPMPDYNSFDYNHAPMPVEPSYSMPRPPPYATATPQMPPPLIMPHNAIWPSMIATQNHHHGSYQPPILPALPVQTPISAGTGSDVTPTSAKTSASRRKLTDDERRQMCLEAEQNPTMKQTQIGGVCRPSPVQNCC